MHALAQILEGTASPAALEELRLGFRIWLASATQGRRDANGKLQRGRPLSLERCLRLPASPERTRIALRNHYLREAAQRLPTGSAKPFAQAAALHSEVQHFLSRRWPCWCNLSQAPCEANEINRLLFEATRWAGGAMPTTDRQFFNILKN